MPCIRLEKRLPCESMAPFGAPVVPEVYMMSAMVSLSTSSGVVISLPSPPMALPTKVSHGTVLGAGEESCSRLDLSGGIGKRKAARCRVGMALIMLMDTTVSRLVVARSFSKVGAALSQAMAMRAP